MIQTKYLVNIEGNTAKLAVVGLASYMNCMGVSEFLDGLEEKNLIIDFSQCTGVDSTFLGLLAKAASKMRSYEPQGNLSIINLNDRLYENVCNLGLDRILTIEKDSTIKFLPEKIINTSTVSKDTMLLAHESLAEIGDDNAQKFQDVITFLKKRVD